MNILIFLFKIFRNAFLSLCMHILIGDSGSTKTDWAYLTEKGTQLFTTQGLNPNHLTKDAIQEILFHQVNAYVSLQEVEKVYFYGAGLGNAITKQYLRDIFEQIFLHATNIIIEHDVLGAAQALYQHGEKGIVCILGTGSIAGYFDGQEITQTSGGLGFLLGDEGSGTYLGKLLIKEYAQQKLPLPIQNALYEHLHIKHTEILHFLYKEPHPNHFLARLTYFLTQFKEQDSIKTILYRAFEDFYVYTVSDLCAKYPQNENIRCVGSVAYLFQQELSDVLQKHNLQIDKILQKPIFGLIERIKNLIVE